MQRRVRLLATIRGLKLELAGFKFPNTSAFRSAQQLLPDAKLRTRKQAFTAIVDAARREFGYVVKPDIKKVYKSCQPKAKPARKAA